jgi:hypothetical protein
MLVVVVFLFVLAMVDYLTTAKQFISNKKKLLIVQNKIIRPNVFALFSNGNNKNEMESDMYPSTLKSSTVSYSKNAVKFGLESAFASFLALQLIKSPENANAASIEETNTLLSGYNLPPILYTPPGFYQLVSEFGRGNVREKIANPILVKQKKTEKKKNIFFFEQIHHI